MLVCIGRAGCRAQACRQDTFGFKDELERSECLQWLFFQMAGLGPMQVRTPSRSNFIFIKKRFQGQANHFHVYAKDKSKYLR